MSISRLAAPSFVGEEVRYSDGHHGTFPLQEHLGVGRRVPNHLAAHAARREDSKVTVTHLTDCDDHLEIG